MQNKRVNARHRATATRLSVSCFAPVYTAAAAAAACGGASPLTLHQEFDHAFASKLLRHTHSERRGCRCKISNAFANNIMCAARRAAREVPAGQVSRNACEQQQHMGDLKFLINIHGVWCRKELIFFGAFFDNVIQYAEPTRALALDLR